MDRIPQLIPLRAIANAFGDLLPQVVFVGGATVALYATTPQIPTPRPTDDVDCIVDVASYAQFAELEEKLRTRGFRNDAASGILIRWLWRAPDQEILYQVDLTPCNGNVLGQNINRWYPSGMQHAQPIQLVEGLEIKILDAPHFLATKLEAMYDRADDIRLSQDWDDIIYVVEMRASLAAEVAAAPAAVRQFIAESFSALLANPEIDERLEYVRDPHGNLDKLWQRCQQLAALATQE